MIRAPAIPETISVRVPFRLVKRGGRKEIHPPPGALAPRKTDSTLIKALARAFRWKRMLDTGEFATITELAAREGIALSYMTRVLQLSLLAPDIVEAILDGRQGQGVTVDSLRDQAPMEWKRQAEAIGMASRA
jgi:hypothetical protein